MATCTLRVRETEGSNPSPPTVSIRSLQAKEDSFGPIVKRYYAAFALPRSGFDSRWVQMIYMKARKAGNLDERIKRCYN